jgi:hypothetical protein
MSRSQALVEAREVTLLELVDRAVDHGVLALGAVVGQRSNPTPAYVLD